MKWAEAVQRATRRKERSMDVFDAVRTVLAVRRYQDKPVPEPTVRRIVLS